MADNTGKNTDNSKKKFNLSKTDIFLFLFVIISVSSAIASTALLQRAYNSNHTSESSFDNNSITAISNTVQTKTTDTKTTKTKTKMTSKTTRDKKTSKSSITFKQTFATTESVNFPVDVNLVTFEELLQINGIGETLAQRIIDFRFNEGTISNMDLLLKIDGIGESKLIILKQYLYVADADYKNTVTSVYTTNAETKATATVHTSVSTLVSQRIKQKVNINVADALEISDCLLINLTLAEKIVDLRSQIQYFSNSLELLYIDELSEKVYNEIKDYIII